MGYVYFDHHVCGEWEKKWKIYGDVNKKVKENECVYKKKSYRHIIWVDIVLERKRSSWKEIDVKQNTWVCRK